MPGFVGWCQCFIVALRLRASVCWPNDHGAPNEEGSRLVRQQGKARAVEMTTDGLGMTGWADGH